MFVGKNQFGGSRVQHDPGIGNRPVCVFLDCWWFLRDLLEVTLRSRCPHRNTHSQKHTHTTHGDASLYCLVQTLPDV